MSDTIRRAVLAIYLLGTVGILGELFLLPHTEDAVQWVPIVLLGLSLLVLGVHAIAPSRVTVRAFQGLMVLFVASGLLGLVLHYRGNVEFELEMQPGSSGWPLFWKAITGATPALAPGTMVQFGLLGLLFSYKHPKLGGTS